VLSSFISTHLPECTPKLLNDHTSAYIPSYITPRTRRAVNNTQSAGYFSGNKLKCLFSGVVCPISIFATHILKKHSAAFRRSLPTIHACWKAWLLVLASEPLLCADRKMTAICIHYEPERSEIVVRLSRR
jgi:hypothetical protein